MLKNKLLLLLLFPLLFWSCDKTVENPNTVIWGETDYYNSFLFKKYEPVIMTQTLVLEFNEDAKRLLNNDIVFEVVEKNGQEKYIHPKYIKIYKNGVLCNGNTFKIEPHVDSVEFGIEFTEKAPEGNHTLYLRVKNGGGLDRIDNTDLSSTGDIILAHEWVVKKEDVFNPLALLSFWVFVVIMAILIACFIISRIVNPTVKFSYVDIDYYDGTGEQRIRMGSSYKLLCTNKKTRFSIFYKFFVGVVKVEVNEFWVTPLTIKSGYSDSIKISGLGNYNLDNDETIRKEPFTIINDNGQKATITTA